jgi:cardiolipin synthase
VHNFSPEEAKDLEALTDEILTPDILFQLNPLLSKLVGEDIGVSIMNSYLINMDHSKVMIVDDTLYAGGRNMGDDYSGGYQGGWLGTKEYWKDYMMRIKGPAVALAAHSFFGQELFIDDHEALRSSDLAIPMRILENKPGESETIIDENTKVKNNPEVKQITYAIHYLIDHAEEEILIQHAYLMDQTIIDKLVAAAARGVNIHILKSQPESPSFGASNEKYFQQLGKVPNIHVYQMNYISHAKVLIVDKKYSIIGSANLSRASLDCHGEISFMISGENHFQTSLLNHLQEAIAEIKEFEGLHSSPLF